MEEHCVGYENGKIYKILDENDNIVYIGSTKTSLEVRWKKHNLYCNQYTIVLIENYACESKRELEKCEQKFIDLYSEMGLFNQRKAYQSKEEKKEQQKAYSKKWYENNKEEKKEYKKKYYDENKEKISEKRKAKINCEICGSLINKHNLAIHNKSKKHLKHIN
tara:strand:- start:7 stop:495 length:489 start_codon:yes stop_codon:yes gene_type:complete